MASERLLTLEFGGMQGSDPVADCDLLVLLAHQTPEAFALFNETLAPGFLNPPMRRLLDIGEGRGTSLPLAVHLKSAHDEASVAKILARDGEWLGEIEVAKPQCPAWSLTLKARVVRLRRDGATVGYAVMARRLAGGVPSGVASVLTKRELQVANAMLAGGTSKAIARQLGISHRTVEAHRSKIMNKLGANSLPEFFQQVVS